MTQENPLTRIKMIPLLSAVLLAACGGASVTTTSEATTAPAAEAPTTSTTTSTTMATTTTATTMAPTTTSTTTATTTTSTTSTSVLGDLPPGDPVVGEELFGTPMPQVPFGDSCSVCHSEGGERLNYGPDLTGIGEVAGERVPGLSAEHYLQQSITDPKAHILKGWTPHMPSNYSDILSDQELADLVAYLLEE